MVERRRIKVAETKVLLYKEMRVHVTDTVITIREEREVAGLIT